MPDLTSPAPFQVTRPLLKVLMGRKRKMHRTPPTAAQKAAFSFGGIMTTLIDTLLVWAFAALLLVVPQYIETLF